MRDGAPAVRTPFLTDQEHPLDSIGDEFSHVDYVDVIVKAVAKLPSPFTLGLFGPWGAGKSSILHAVGDQVDRPSQTAFVLFDAWKYEGDPLRRQFMIDVTRQLKQKGHLRRRFDVRRHLERYDADVTGSRPQFEFDWRSLVRAVLLGGVAVAAVYGLYALLPNIGVSDSDALRTTLAGVTGGLTFVLTLLSSAFVIQRQQVTRRRLQDADEFADSFESLLEKGLTAPRLVIGVDNLDRCAPEKVTELLATMKTYLEPGRKSTALTFIVAADDSALRRHLIAQEMSVSAATAATAGEEDDDHAPSPDQRVPDDVVQAVDEYLRKYFNGVIRLGELIDEDLERFVDRQLDGFALEHRLSDWTRAALQQLIVGHLGGNPRRIKQFVNGLQFRCALLKRRKEHGRLAVIPDVLTVAELMLLEERWPERFAMLRHDTHAAGEWKRELMADGAVRRRADAESDWLRFLSTSRRVLEARVSPYMSLKQGEAEASLEHYTAFIAALESGEAQRVREVLGQTDNPDDYRKLIWPRFWRHFCRDRDGAAYRVFASTVGLSTQLDDDDVDRMLSLALRRNTLRVRLRDLGPDVLLELARRLGPDERLQLIRIVLRDFARPGPDGGVPRRAISAALAARPELLTEEICESLRTMIGRPHVLADAVSWAPLAAVKPGLVPTEACLTNAVDNRQHSD